MTKREKLKRILDKLAPFDSSAESAFKPFEDEIAKITATFKDTVNAKTIEQVNAQFRQLNKAFKPLIKSFEQAKVELIENDRRLLAQLKERLAELTFAHDQAQEMSEAEIRKCEEEMAEIRKAIREVEVPHLLPRIKAGEQKLLELVKKVNERIPSTKETEEGVKELKEEIERVRQIAESTPKGGNANRLINVNSSVMSSKYTDINFQQFGNIGWTAVNDDTNKRVNIRASILAGGGGSGTPGGNDTEIQYNASGAFAGDPAFTWASSILTVGQQGSVFGRIRLAGADTGTVTVQPASTAGNWTLTLPPNDGAANQVLTTDGNGVSTWASVAASGSGITRSVSVISVSSTFAAAASTDYVAFTNVGIALTLPTATSNSNLYTVKNTSSSSVLVLAPVGQDIDGSASTLMALENESLSFISNSSVWGVI